MTHQLFHQLISVGLTVDSLWSYVISSCARRLIDGPTITYHKYWMYFLWSEQETPIEESCLILTWVLAVKPLFLTPFLGLPRTRVIDRSSSSGEEEEHTDTQTDIDTIIEHWYMIIWCSSSAVRHTRAPVCQNLKGGMLNLALSFRKKNILFLDERNYPELKKNLLKSRPFIEPFCSCCMASPLVR